MHGLNAINAFNPENKIYLDIDPKQERLIELRKNSWSQYPFLKVVNFLDKLPLDKLLVECQFNRIKLAHFTSFIYRRDPLREAVKKITSIMFQHVLKLYTDKEFSRDLSLLLVELKGKTNCSMEYIAELAEIFSNGAFEDAQKLLKDLSILIEDQSEKEIEQLIEKVSPADLLKIVEKTMQLSEHIEEGVEKFEIFFAIIKESFLKKNVISFILPFSRRLSSFQIIEGMRLTAVLEKKDRSLAMSCFTELMEGAETEDRISDVIKQVAVPKKLSLLQLAGPLLQGCKSKRAKAVSELKDLPFSEGEKLVGYILPYIRHLQDGMEIAHSLRILRNISGDDTEQMIPSIISLIELINVFELDKIIDLFKIISQKGKQDELKKFIIQLPELLSDVEKTQRSYYLVHLIYLIQESARESSISIIQDLLMQIPFESLSDSRSEILLVYLINVIEKSPISERAAFLKNGTRLMTGILDLANKIAMLDMTLDIPSNELEVGLSQAFRLINLATEPYERLNLIKSILTILPDNRSLYLKWADTLITLHPGRDCEEIALILDIIKLMGGKEVNIETSVQYFIELIKPMHNYDQRIYFLNTLKEVCSTYGIKTLGHLVSGHYNKSNGCMIANMLRILREIPGNHVSQAMHSAALISKDVEYHEEMKLIAAALKKIPFSYRKEALDLTMKILELGGDCQSKIQTLQLLNEIWMEDWLATFEHSLSFLKDEVIPSKRVEIVKTVAAIPIQLFPLTKESLKGCSIAANKVLMAEEMLKQNQINSDFDALIDMFNQDLSFYYHFFVSKPHLLQYMFDNYTEEMFSEISPDVLKLGMTNFLSGRDEVLLKHPIQFQHTKRSSLEIMQVGSYQLSKHKEEDRGVFVKGFVTDFIKKISPTTIAALAYSKPDLLTPFLPSMSKDLQSVVSIINNR